MSGWHPSTGRAQQATRAWLQALTGESSPSLRQSLHAFLNSEDLRTLSFIAVTFKTFWNLCQLSTLYLNAQMTCALACLDACCSSPLGLFIQDHAGILYFSILGDISSELFLDRECPQQLRMNFLLWSSHGTDASEEDKRSLPND